MSLDRKAWLSLAVFAVVMAALIFAAAGSIRDWRGWAFLAVIFGAAIPMTADLIARDPSLLERRLAVGPTAERRPAQRLIMVAVFLGYAALIVVPPLARRYDLAPTSAAVSILGDILVALGNFGISRVYRENSFAAATIGLAEGQRVISTGPYAIVRHPMYASGLVYLMGAPLALGSWWGLAPLAAMFPLLVWRLFDEESFLGESLPGYREYMARVRWRLLPGVF
jgi:protein-S-isoprenylcysteine O-methyltransferase Ste14